MLAIFREYNIIPIFVFDGKPPPEKKELLQKRREDKTAAKNEYNKLKNQLDQIQDESDNEIREQSDKEIDQNLDVIIYKKKQNQVKNLF